VIRDRRFHTKPRRVAEIARRGATKPAGPLPVRRKKCASGPAWRPSSSATAAKDDLKYTRQREFPEKTRPPATTRSRIGRAGIGVRRARGGVRCRAACRSAPTLANCLPTIRFASPTKPTSTATQRTAILADPATILFAVRGTGDLWELGRQGLHGSAARQCKFQWKVRRRTTTRPTPAQTNNRPGTRTTGRWKDRRRPDPEPGVGQSKVDFNPGVKGPFFVCPYTIVQALFGSGQFEFLDPWHGRIGALSNSALTLHIVVILRYSKDLASCASRLILRSTSGMTTPNTFEVWTASDSPMFFFAKTQDRASRRCHGFQTDTTRMRPTKQGDESSCLPLCSVSNKRREFFSPEDPVICRVAVGAGFTAVSVCIRAKRRRRACRCLRSRLRDHMCGRRDAFILPGNRQRLDVLRSGWKACRLHVQVNRERRGRVGIRRCSTVSRGPAGSDPSRRSPTRGSIPSSRAPTAACVSPSTVERRTASSGTKGSMYPLCRIVNVVLMQPPAIARPASRISLSEVSLMRPLSRKKCLVKSV